MMCNAVCEPYDVIYKPPINNRYRPIIYDVIVIACYKYRPVLLELAIM